MTSEVFLCYVNRAGTEHCSDTNKDVVFCGHSTIVGPDGVDLVRANATDHKLLVAELRKDDPLHAKARVENTYLKDRRPNLYSRSHQ